jgi:hypothetical protein
MKFNNLRSAPLNNKLVVTNTRWVRPVVYQTTF